MNEEQRLEKIQKHVVRRQHDSSVLETESFHHQFVALSGLAIKRYVKRELGALLALRADYWDSKDVRPDGFLEIYLKTSAKGWNRETPIPMRYEDNVIELYTAEDVQSFERKNRRLIESGALIEYVDGHAFQYEASKFEEWEHRDKDDTVVWTQRIGKEFRLEEITAPFAHDLQLSNVSVE